jgi:hypothetical protein
VLIGGDRVKELRLVLLVEQRVDYEFLGLQQQDAGTTPSRPSRIGRIGTARAVCGCASNFRIQRSPVYLPRRSCVYLQWVGPLGGGAMRADMSDRGTRTYLVLSGVLILAGLVVASVLLAGKDFRDHGPLSPPGSTLRQDPAVEQVLSNCHDANIDNPEVFKQVVTAIVDGRRLHACYTAAPTPGGYSDVMVIDGSARQVDEPDVLKAVGAWPWRGTIVRAEHLLFGVIAGAALCLLGLLYYRAPLRGPALQSGPRGVGRRPRSWARRAKVAGRFAFVLVALQIGALSWEAVRVQDVWGMATMSFLVAGFILATVGGWFWLIHPDFDRARRCWAQASTTHAITACESACWRRILEPAAESARFAIRG